MYWNVAQTGQPTIPGATTPQGLVLRRVLLLLEELVINFEFLFVCQAVPPVVCRFKIQGSFAVVVLDKDSRSLFSVPDAVVSPPVLYVVIVFCHITSPPLL